MLKSERAERCFSPAFRFLGRVEEITIMKIIMLRAGCRKRNPGTENRGKVRNPHISTGDIFRANIKNGTELGKKAKAFMDQGLLVPDELTVDLVMDRISQPDCKEGTSSMDSHVRSRRQRLSQRLLPKRERRSISRSMSTYRMRRSLPVWQAAVHA